jgi:hypothetical protein
VHDTLPLCDLSHAHVAKGHCADCQSQQIYTQTVLVSRAK